jgi:F0F1-type ATP synthase beta subunit
MSFEPFSAVLDGHAKGAYEEALEILGNAGLAELALARANAALEQKLPGTLHRTTAAAETLSQMARRFECYRLIMSALRSSRHTDSPTNGPDAEAETRGADVDAMLRSINNEPGDYLVAVQTIDDNDGQPYLLCFTCPHASDATSNAQQMAPLLERRELRRAARALSRVTSTPPCPARLLDTGIKAVDLLCPIVRGTTVALQDDGRAGRLILLKEIVRNVAVRYGVSFFRIVVSGSAETTREQAQECVRGAALRMPTALTVFLDMQETGGDPSDAVVPDFATRISLTRRMAGAGLFPAIDPLRCASRALDPEILGYPRYRTSVRARHYLRRLAWSRATSANAPTKQIVLARARKLELFMTQPSFTIESLTHRSGRHVEPSQTIQCCNDILAGRYDQFGDDSFLNIGAADEAVARERESAEGSAVG